MTLPQFTLLFEWYIVLVMTCLAPGMKQMLPIVFLKAHSTDVFLKVITQVGNKTKWQVVIGTHLGLSNSPLNISTKMLHRHLKLSLFPNEQFLSSLISKPVLPGVLLMQINNSAILLAYRIEVPYAFPSPSNPTSSWSLSLVGFSSETPLKVPFHLLFRHCLVWSWCFSVGATEVASSLFSLTCLSFLPMIPDSSLSDLPNMQASLTVFSLYSQRLSFL